MENRSQLNCNVPNLWQEHQKELKNFIYKRVKDREVVNDISQEVLLKVYTFCQSKSGVRNVRSWLFQIAQNTITDHFRKQAKFSDKDIPEKPVEDENMAFKDAARFIVPMLEFLPEAYSIPLKLSDIDGVKQADIAKQLGLGLPATKSRIQRARLLLMEEFITCCHFEKDPTGNLILFEIKDSCAPLQKIKKEIF